MNIDKSNENHFPLPGDYRIAKEADENGKYGLWQCKVGSLWIFKRAMLPQEAYNFTEDKGFLFEDGKYDYWRGQQQ